MARVAWRNLTIWKKIASDIKYIRKWKGLTDFEVSKRLGMELKVYRKIERGQVESVTLKNIMDMMTLFNVTLDEIIPL